VSLREQFGPDLVEVFHNPDEFGSVREFRISDGQGGFRIFTASVVWDEEAAAKLPLVTIHGVYLGTVICHIKHIDLPRPPVAGEIIYSPANRPFETIKVWDEEGEWRIALNETRSQPGFYGAN
jgi:hypothetical protein